MMRPSSFKNTCRIFKMILQEIKKEYGNSVIKECKDSGCCLNMHKMSDYMMLKGELVSPDQKMCDCIIFHSSKKVIHVELKSKSLDPGQIIDQFTNAGQKSWLILASLDSTDRFEPVFILLAKKYQNHSAVDMLRRKKIKIQGNRYSIRLEHCGDLLRNLIS